MIGVGGIVATSNDSTSGAATWTSTVSDAPGWMLAMAATESPPTGPIESAANADVIAFAAAVAHAEADAPGAIVTAMLGAVLCPSSVNSKTNALPAIVTPNCFPLSCPGGPPASA